MSHPGETTRILLVGDDRAVYLALRDALSAGRALGFELEWVDDADAALAKMRSGEFSLVLVGDDAWRYSDVLKRQDPRAVVVVVRRGADERVETALIEAMMRLDLQRRSGPASVGPSAGYPAYGSVRRPAEPRGRDGSRRHRRRLQPRVA